MCACPAVGPRQDSGVMPFCAGMLPSATITASAPTIRFISGLDHTAYTLPVYASQRGLPRYHATLGSGCRHTWPGRTGYPLGSNEKFQRCSHLLPISQAWPGAQWLKPPGRERTGCGFRKIGDSAVGLFHGRGDGEVSRHKIHTVPPSAC